MKHLCRERYDCEGEGGMLLMEKKAVSGILLTLLLTGMLTLAFSVQTARADFSTIHIRADGSIDPPTALYQLLIKSPTPLLLTLRLVFLVETEFR